MKYDGLLFIAGLFLVMAMPTADAYNQDRLQWVDWTSGEVYWGDNFSFGDYLLYAADFPSLNDFQATGTPFVSLYLFDNGSYITSLPLASGDSYIYKDEIRISITEIIGPEQVKWRGDLYNPRATIKVERLGSPSLSPSYSISFKDQELFKEWKKVNCTGDNGTGKDWVTRLVYDEDYGRYRRARSYETVTTGTTCNSTYTFISSTNDVLSIPPGSLISMNVRFSNTGTADAFSTSVKIIPDLVVNKGQLEFYTGDLKTGEESMENTIELIAPGGLTDTKQYSVHVIVTGKDIKGNPINSDIYFYFNIGRQWNLVLNKYATSTLWLNGTAYVTLSAYNDGWMDLNNIRINDTVSDKFNYSGERSNWTISLPAGKSWSITYPLRPREVGTFTHPEAKADFEVSGKGYTLYSGRPSTVVHGVAIRLDKSVDIEFLERNKTTDVTVIVTARNTGDIDAEVTMKDLDIVRKKVLKTGESDSFSYTMHVTNETILPPATASYFTLYGDKGSITSNQVTLKMAAFEIQASEMKPFTPRMEKRNELYYYIYIMIICILLISGGFILWKRRKLQL